MKELQSDFEAIDQVLTALHRAAFQYKSWGAIQQAAGVSIDRSAATILKTLQHDDTIRPLELARLLGIEAPSITRKLQQLEADGYVSRKPDPTDGRAARIAITKRGREVIGKLQAARQKRIAAAFKDWDKHDRRELIRLLTRLGEELTTTNIYKPTKEGKANE